MLSQIWLFVCAGGLALVGLLVLWYQHYLLSKLKTLETFVYEMINIHTATLNLNSSGLDALSKGVDKQVSKNNNLFNELKERLSHLELNTLNDETLQNFRSSFSEISREVSSNLHDNRQTVARMELSMLHLNKRVEEIQSYPIYREIKDVMPSKSTMTLKRHEVDINTLSSNIKMLYEKINEMEKVNSRKAKIGKYKKNGK